MRPAARIAGLPHALAARISALPQLRQEWLADLGLAVALAAVNVISLVPYQARLHPFWLALVLVIAQGIPLAWRRARPVAIGLGIGVARVAYDRLGFGFAPLPLGPAIAFYTIIDRRGPVWRWVTCAIVVIGVFLSQSGPGHSEPYDAIFQAFIFLTAWAAGVLSRIRRASLHAAESRADRAEAELDRQTARAAALERSRIAHVSLMAVQAAAAASLLPKRPAEAQRSVEIIGTTARQALTELRRLLGVLRGPSERVQTSPAASLADLGALIDQVRDAGLPVDFEVTGMPFPLAPGVDLTAYRIVQEALTNSLRHGQSARVAVALCYEPGHISVSVTDCGPAADRGVRVAAGSALGSRRPGPHGSGLGLAGIAERVASCGGQLTVGPTSADGFAVTARLPAL
jgi:signal transduction histidine kinase